MKPLEKLLAKWAKGQFMMVGLDTDPEKIHFSLKEKHKGNEMDAMLDFNKQIVNKTKGACLGYKINIAFYEKYGKAGLDVFWATIHHIRESAPDAFTIADVKRGDIGNTNEGYTVYLKSFDAMTISGYFGKDANTPFFTEEFKDKIIIVLAKTSNKGSADIQDLEAEGLPIYLHMAKKVKTWGPNYALVVGGTHPTHLMRVRDEIGPDGLILCPGVGAQQADLKSIIQCGVNKEGTGIIINASRSIIFASNSEYFADHARDELKRLNEEIAEYLQLPRILWENERAKVYEDRTIQILKEMDAILENDHFVYKAGNHGSKYINKDAVTPDAVRIDEIGKMMADLGKDEDFDVIVAPAFGGIVVGNITAKYSTYFKGHTIHSIFAEKNGEDAFKLTRGYPKFVKGKKVWIVEDIVTSGKSIRHLITCIEAAGGEVMGVTLICNRGEVTAEQLAPNIKLISLSSFTLETYPANECPLCKEGVEVNIELGHGKQFKENLTETVN